MASSDIEICNRALQTYLRAGRITSMDENSVAAEQCALHYRPTVRSLLVRHPWSWATERAPLALLVNDRADQWGYAYAKPAEAVRIRWVNDARSAQALARTGRWHDAPRSMTATAIYSDAPGAVAEYTADHGDPTRFSPAFDDALAAALAANMAMAITEDARKAQYAAEKAGELLDVAMVLDLNESPPAQPVNVPGWLAARGLGPSVADSGLPPVTIPPLGPQSGGEGADTDYVAIYEAAKA